MSTERPGPLPATVVIDRHIPTGVSIYGYTADQMLAYAAQQVAAERERCAAVCEGVREAADHAARDGPGKTGAMTSAALCAKLIRA